MARNKINSRVLRQLAEELVQKFAEELGLSENDQGDFATSLVRQWITYDGHATLFLGEQQVYFVLGKTPLGKPYPIPEPALPGWINRLTEDWKISPDDLPDIFDQLNRGQSAEVTNDEGTPLRLWVNPRNQGRGVEALVKEAIPAEAKRDYHKIAAAILEQHLGEGLDPDEMEELVCSVAKQWQQYEGHACLFLEGEQLVFTVVELGQGNCRVDTQAFQVSLEPVLGSLGFSPEVAIDVIARINLGQETEFRNRQGIPSLLWYDPRQRRILVRPINPVPPLPWGGGFTI